MGFEILIVGGGMELGAGKSWAERLDKDPCPLQLVWCNVSEKALRKALVAE
jgi:NAD(P)H-flavin reductase